MGPLPNDLVRVEREKALIYLRSEVTSFSTAFSSIPSREAFFSIPKSARTGVGWGLWSDKGDT